MAFEYLTDYDFVVKRTRFDYAGATYEGQGFLRWQPKEGFNLDLLLERKGPPIKKYTIGFFEIPSKSSYKTLRMVLSSDHKAIVPYLYLGERLDIISQHRLSIRPYRVIFISHHKNYQSIKAGGQALFACHSLPYFEGKLEKEEKVDGKVIRSGMSVGGFRHVEPGVSVVGTWESEKENTIRLGWSLDSPRDQVQKNWSFAEALRDALAMLSGQNVQMMSREVCGCGVNRSELRRKIEVTTLGLLSLFGTSPHIRKSPLVKLALFLATNNSNARLCRKMFSQMVDASKQETNASQQLLCAMVLEAALRTIYRVPSPKGLNVRQSLQRFKTDYLDNDWSEAIGHVERAFNNLRNRNAHPNWLTTPDGAEAPEKMRENLDDLILLSLFYGYMILALAGFKELKPRFPKSCREWDPMLTYETDDPQ